MNKSKTSTAIALTLMFAMTLSLAAIPEATAQQTRVTYAYIGALPNPAGVGQEVLLHLGITHPSQWPQDGWSGLTVTVERPDGTTETLGPYTTDTTGGTGAVYIPTMTGEYTFQTHFPEQITNVAGYGTPAGTLMLASSSGIMTLVLQEDRTPEHPGFPLPTEYWTRPIDAQLWEWNPIAGNWLSYARGSDASPTSSIAPYTTGPETGHILWAKPLVLGGLA
jgi:hypothetical protein